MARKNIWIALATLILVMMIPSVALAKEAEAPIDQVSVDSEYVEVTTENADPEGLYEQYINQLFYGKTEEPAASTKKKFRKASAGSKLTGQNAAIYEVLKPAIKKVADGNSDTGIIQVPLSALGMESGKLYTQEELGLDYMYDFTNNSWNPGIGPAMRAMFDFDGNVIKKSLDADCPYEIYWNNGKMSYSLFAPYTYGYKNGTGYAWFTSDYLTFQFYVDTKYLAEGGDDFSVDTEKTGAAKNASENAKGIVSDAESKDDYNKLLHYKEKICELVVYNTDAAQGNTGKDHGAWALIYVFDNDPETNVVCEGYSEAFQYLCQLTEFDSDLIDVYSVTGVLGGPHKWNVIHMNDEKNYIADVTNSEENTIGQSGQLFLKGMAGSVSEGYSKDLYGETYTYTYNEDTMSMFSEEELTLSDSDFTYETSHTYGDWMVTKAATCEEKGQQKKVCESCGIVVYEDIEAIGHDYGAWEKADENTHQRICGNDATHVETEDHIWDEGKVTKAPTCTKEGVRTYTCTVCHAEKTESIKATGHDYGAWEKKDENTHQRICGNDATHVETEDHEWDEGEVTKAPTCTEEGIRTYTCTVCKAERTESIEATGHDYGAWEKKDEKMHQRVCGNDVTHVETEDHAWDEGKVTKAPTCTEEGIRTYTCIVCHAKRTESIEAIGHDFGAWEKKDGNTHQRTCRNNANHVETEDHAWGEGEVTKAPTCTEEGIRTYTCTVCKAERTESIEATGHNYGAWEKADENTHQRICGNDATHVETEDHTWDEGKVTEAPTCREEGIRTYTCTVCKAERTESIEATGHDYGAWEKKDESTHQRFCRNDGMHVETAPHKFEKEVIITEPTCTEEGEKKLICTECEAEKTEAIQPLDHDWEKAYETDVPPTCTEDGVQSIHCRRCSETKSQKPVEAIGHAWSAPTYTWAEDKTSVTAQCTCENDANHVQTETAETSQEITKEPTYTQRGVITYTVVFENPLFEKQDRAENSIPVLEKMKNTMSVKAVKKTVKAKKLKKKAVTVTPIQVKNAKGKVTYKLISGSKKAKKALKINARTGKIKITKKTKKGIYKVRVKASTPGTEQYKAYQKIVTISIRVR